LALVIVALPIAIVANLFSKGRDCSPEEFAADVQKLADGTEGERDWDVLESVRLKDPRLEAIRQEAIAVPWPIDQEGRAKLSSLAQRARNIASYLR
jgi:hypothetical protein